jgi:hypothetical protein
LHAACPERPDDRRVDPATEAVVKIGIIGTGNVGCACAMAAVTRGSAREIVLVNRTRKTAEAVATDMRYGTPLGPKVDIVDGDYDDLKGAGIVLITVGVNEKTGGATDRNDPLGRLKLLDRNAKIYRDIVPRIVRAAPNAVLLVVSDPPDPLADIAREASPGAVVLSTGTYLDSQRFRVHLGKHFGADPAHVEAQVIGDHGTSQVFLWSSAGLAEFRWRPCSSGAASGWTSCGTSSSETCATPTSPSSRAMMPANTGSASYRPESPRWCSTTSARSFRSAAIRRRLASRCRCRASSVAAA